MKRLVGAASLLLMLAGCEETGVPKQAGGTLVGAGVGGLAGSQLGGGTGKLAMTGLGVLIGALMGSDVGKSLDRADQLAMEKTTRDTLESAPPGQVAQWRNPQTGHSGTVTPWRRFQSADGAYCREFQQTIQVGDHVEQAFGTACRQPDGTWRIVA
jgi:surface antigen